jgi:hypothetical protein
MPNIDDFEHLTVLHSHIALHADVIEKLEARAAREDASEDQKTTIAAIVALLKIDAKLIAHMAEENATFRDQMLKLSDAILKTY